MQKLILFLAFSIFSIQMSQAHNGPSTVTATTLNVDDTNCQLTSPGNFYPVTIGAHNVVLHYDDVPGAIGYDIRAYIGGSQYGAPAFAPYGAVTYDFGGLPSGTTIEFRIRSICGNGEIGDIYTPTTATTVIIELIAALETPCSDPGSGFNTVTINTNGYGDAPITLSATSNVTKWGQVTVNGVKKLVFRMIFPKATITDNSPVELRKFNPESPEGSLCVIDMNGSCNAAGPGAPARMYVNNDFVGNFTFTKPANGGTEGHLLFSDVNNSTYQIALFTRNCPPPIKQNDDEGFAPPTGTVNNPFHDLLVYNSETLTEDDVTLSLMDMNGRILRTQKMAGGQDQYSLQTADITPGMYVLRVQTGKQVKVLQVVKTN